MYNNSEVISIDLVVKEISHDFAKNLRKRSTDSEKIFWEAVRNRKFMGKKFLRQYPIKLNHNGNKDFLIADFYCHEARLIIELDGKIHDFQKEYDELRDYMISTLKVTVLRFKNEEIENNIDIVLEKIKEHIKLKINDK